MNNMSMVILSYIPFIMLFVIYYKVFRIAADVKEIKEMLKKTKNE